jgi:hypothetical protein
MYAKTPKPDLNVYGPPPTKEDLNKLALSLETSSSDAAKIKDSDERGINSLIVTYASAGDPYAWCFPNDEGTYCGWMVRLDLKYKIKGEKGSVWGIDPLRKLNANTTVDMGGNKHIYSSVFMREGNVVAWQGAISDFRDFMGLNRVFNPIFIDSKTGAAVQVKLDIAGHLASTPTAKEVWFGATQSIYADYSYQLGFFLVGALERAGFHRSDSLGTPASYVLNATLSDIKIPPERKSIPATAKCSLTVLKGASPLSKSELEATKVSPVPLKGMYGFTLASMNMAFEDVATQAALELQKQIDLSSSAKKTDGAAPNPVK